MNRNARLSCVSRSVRCGRPLVLLADVQRDQGPILDPRSAHQSYLTARVMFCELDIPRRVAQIELSLAVTPSAVENIQIVLTSGWAMVRACAAALL